MSQLLRFVSIAVLGLLGLAVQATAETYPERVVRIVNPYPPGGSVDVMARILAQKLTDDLGQQVIVENRSGGGGNTGSDFVAKAEPDGYTLLVVTSVNAINASVYEKLNFNLIRDVVPVASIHREPFVMEANPSVPVKTVAEFIAYAKANPGKLTMASAGIGSGNHISGELFKMMTGVNLVHVPYRGGGPALVDLISGQVQVLFATMSSSIEYVRAGKLRALAVTTATRSSVLPDIPTVAEFVPGYESSFWTGVGAPKNTPAEIVDKLNKEMNATLADPKFKARLADLGGTALSGSPLDFGKFVADETEKWAKVVKFAGVKAD